MLQNVTQPDSPPLTTWRKRISCWLPKATNTNIQVVKYLLFSTTTMAAGTRLNVTLYVHCLFFFKYIQSGDSTLLRYDGKYQSRGFDIS